MLTLARFTLRGPYRAAAVVGLLAMLAVFVPPIAPNAFLGVVAATICMTLSCVMVGLIILTQGTNSGLQAIGAAIVGITVVGWILVQAPELGLVTALVQWLPIIVLAQTLRSTNSLALMLLAGAVIGAIGIVAQYGFWGDLETQWSGVMMDQLAEMGSTDERILQRNRDLVVLFVTALVAVAYFTVAGIVLLARWLQARIAESDGGFGREFRALMLGKTAAAVALVLLLASFWIKQGWLSSLALLGVIAFLFQGIAIVHAKLAARRQARALFGVFYALLLVFPQVVALTSITGMIDNWLDFRKLRGNRNDTSQN